MQIKPKIKSVLALIALVISTIIFIYFFKNSENLPPYSEVENITDALNTKASTNIVAPPKQKLVSNKNYKSVITTLFWVGEKSDASNGYIPNHESFWDSFWLEHYGGVDSPEKRCGFLPCAFTPKENPFYFALPYGDLDSNGYQLESTKSIPWYKKTEQNESFLKNSWIEITYKKKTCYAQWEDVGPFELNDFDYVFGNSKPKNTFGVSAGLDISPATWDCLNMTDNDRTEWRFVSENDVPNGPWKETVTTRGVSF